MIRVIFIEQKPGIVNETSGSAIYIRGRTCEIAAGLENYFAERISQSSQRKLRLPQLAQIGKTDQGIDGTNGRSYRQGDTS